jgi:hypothetical protein
LDRQNSFYDFPYLSLFYYLWHRYEGDARYLAIAQTLRDQACARALKLNESPNLFASFLADHVAAGIWRDEIPGGVPLYEDHLDHFISKAQRWATLQTQAPVELLNGVLASGLLGLQLKDDHLVSASLEAIAERFRSPRREMNLGIAHGVAGLLLFLLYARLRGYYSVHLDTIVEQIVTDILEVEEQTLGAGLPAVWPLPAVARSRPQTAWCNGDAGVGFALAVYERVSGNSVPHAKIFERGTRLVELGDSGLCHGKGGMMQLCRRYVEVTNQIELRLRQEQWEAQILTEEVVSSDRSLQYGDLGIALELLSQEVNVDLAWDRVFLLSCPWGMKHGFNA